MKLLILLLVCLDIDIRRVVDGDTVVAHVQVSESENIWFHDRSIRLHGVYAPELRDPEGKKYKQFVEKWLFSNAPHELSYEPMGRDKYGRLLGKIHGPKGCLNDAVNERLKAPISDGLPPE